MHPNTRGLAFLLSLGSLPLGCFKDEMSGGSGTSGAGTTGTAGTTGADTTGATTGEPTVGLAGTSAADTTTGETGTSAGDTSTGSSGASSSGEASGSGTTQVDPVDPGDQCLAYAARLAACIPRYAGARPYFAALCEMTKQQGEQLDGQACRDALEAYFVCLATADCAEFDERGLGPCPNQSLQAQVACPNSSGG